MKRVFITEFTDGTAKDEPMKNKGTERENQKDELMKNKGTEQENQEEIYDLLADWFDGHPKKREAEGHVLPVSPEVKAFMDFLWPMAEPYYAPVPGVFLMQVSSFDLLNAKPVWLVRDGLLPLLWFFRLHPNPEGLNSKLLIEESLLPFVPSQWSRSVGSYKLVSTAKRNGKRKLLFVGYLSEFFMPLDEIGLWLGQTFANESAEELKTMAKTVFLPFRQWHFQSDNDHVYHLMFVRKLIELMGSDFEAINQKRLQQLESTHGFEIISANTNLLLSDNALVHQLLSKGGNLYGSYREQNSTDCDFIAFSPYHGIQVRMNPEVSSIGRAWRRSLAETEKYQESLSRALSSDAHTKLPWPQWFSDWARVEMKKHRNHSKK
jgi:hypothetical protein